MAQKRAKLMEYGPLSVEVYNLHWRKLYCIRTARWVMHNRSFEKRWDRYIIKALCTQFVELWSDAQTSVYSLNCSEACKCYEDVHWSVYSWYCVCVYRSQWCSRNQALFLYRVKFTSPLVRAGTATTHPRWPAQTGLTGQYTASNPSYIYWLLKKS